MEADWDVEIGGEAPVIDADWEGFIDLRRDPAAAAHLPETAAVPALADALIRLNASSSPVWTAKSDVWHPEENDPDEMNAAPGEGNCAIACYIDLLPVLKRWRSTEEAIQDCKRLCAQLQSHAVQCCRADLVIRRAIYKESGDSPCVDLGVTAYLTACGRTQAASLSTLSRSLRLFAECAASPSHPAAAPSKLQ